MRPCGVSIWHGVWSAAVAQCWVWEVRQPSRCLNKFLVGLCYCIVAPNTINTPNSGYLKGCSFLKVHSKEKKLVATVAHQFGNWKGTEMTQTVSMDFCLSFKHLPFPFQPNPKTSPAGVLLLVQHVALSSFRHCGRSYFVYH